MRQYERIEYDLVNKIPYKNYTISLEKVREGLEVEEHILTLLQYKGPMDIDTLLSNLDYTERQIKEAVWRMAEDEAVMFNTQWQLELWKLE